MKNKPEYWDKLCGQCAYFTRVKDDRLWKMLFPNNLCGEGACTNYDDLMDSKKPLITRYRDDIACIGFKAK